jgi:hypothetical protein
MEFLENLPSDVKFGLNFIHPVLMWTIFATTLYAAYLGFKIRETRTTKDAELRKKLIPGKFAQKHYLMGSIVLALVTLGTVGGMLVTYINNGKLFVGAHLLAGLGMLSILAVSTALSPLMQKGSEWARYTHITLNLVMVSIFGWQALTGVQIVQRIISSRAGV